MGLTIDNMLYDDWGGETVLYSKSSNDAQYDVTISTDDKLLSLTENGELLADIGLSYENNILTLTGRDDGLEIASIELPNSLTSLSKFEITEGEEGKEIVISFEQADGTETSLSINVDELATAYKAGLGLELTDDNTFNVKLKTGSLLGFTEEGELDMNLDMAYPTMQQVTAEFSKYDGYITQLNSSVSNLSGQIDGINALLNQNSESVSGLQETLAEYENIANKLTELENTDTELASAHTEIYEAISGVADANSALQERVDEVSASCKSVLNSALANDTIVQSNLESKLNIEVANRTNDKTALENSINSATTELNAKIEEVRELIPTDYVSREAHVQWEGKIATLVDITQWIDENGDVVNTGKIVSICSDVDELASKVSALTEVDNATEAKLGALSAISTTNSETIGELESALSAETAERIAKDAELLSYIEATNASANTTNLKVSLLIESVKDISGSYVSHDDIELLENVVAQNQEVVQGIPVQNAIFEEAILGNTSAITKNHNDIVALSAKTKTLETAVSSLTDTVVSYNDDLNSVTNRVSDLETQYAVLSAKVENILVRLQALENGFVPTGSTTGDTSGSTSGDTSDETSGSTEPTEPTEGGVIFYESFNSCEGSGGNDGKFGGAIATGAFVPDKSGWKDASGAVITGGTFASGAYQCAKFGTSKVIGTVQSPTFNYSGNVRIFFNAAAWAGTSTGLDLVVYINDTQTFVASMSTTDMQTFIFDCELAGSSYLRFVPTGRFFLDEVKVVELL